MSTKTTASALAARILANAAVRLAEYVEEQRMARGPENAHMVRDELLSDVQERAVAEAIEEENAPDMHAALAEAVAWSDEMKSRGMWTMPGEPPWVAKARKLTEGR
jgi:hypothetical protein